MSDNKAINVEQNIADRNAVIKAHTDQVIKVIEECREAGLRGIEVTLYHHEAYPTVIMNVLQCEDVIGGDITGRAVVQTPEGPVVQVSVVFYWD